MKMLDNNNTQLIIEGPNFQKSGLVHRLKLPTSPGPHPTVVMLHGRLGNEDVMWIFARALPAHWLLVAPRAIVPERDGYSWHPTRETWPALPEFDDAVTAVSHFIQTLPQIHQADPSQIYLMGFSQGAATAFATALYYPELISGIAGLVGFMPDHAEHLFAKTPLENLPVLMLVGEQDQAIPLETARRSGEAVRAAGARLEYREYSTGHKLNGEGMRKLKNWWLAIEQDR